MKLETKPSNIRLPLELKARIQRLAITNGLTSSDIIRLTLTMQLPEIEAGRFKLRPVFKEEPISIKDTLKTSR